MIAAIPIAEKILAGLATIAAGAPDATSGVDARKTGAADATDFAKTLDQLDQTAAAKRPNHAAAPTVTG